MAQAEDKNLPSLDDYIIEDKFPSVEEAVDTDLPSLEDNKESVLPSIEEEVEAELPSVDDYVEKEEEELVEEVVVEEDLTLDEVKELIEEVKAEILDIPQIKHFDEVLEKLCEAVDQVKSEIPEVPEPKVYDDEIEAICDAIDAVKENISSLPEVKYYDEQVQNIEDRIDSVIQEVANLPEPKYYDTDLDSIKEDITKVREELAPLPWVENTFSGIEENFEKVSDVIDTLKEKLNFNFDEYSDSIDVKFFESKVETQGIKEEFESEKEKIWDELKKSSVKIFEYQKTFKDDDRKLKKQILGEYNTLKNNIKKELEEATDKSVKTDELLLGYFTELKEEISNLPEVKYYDEEINELQKLVSKFNKRFSPVEGDIKSLYRIVEDIKKTQIELNEQILDEPADVSQDIGGGKDPLTPTDQKFATLDDLSKHYTLFVNRIQQQLSTVGGGGAGFIKDLADVDISGLADQYILQYNASENKWETVANSGSVGVATAAASLVLDARNNNIGYGLTIGTPVYQTTFNSGKDRINIEEARASDSSTMPAKGVVRTDLANNTNGTIIVYGELEGVDTSAFDVADELYVAPGGGLTNVRPTDPTHLVQKIAVVLKKSAANGAILVYGAGRTNDVPNTISIAGSVTAASFHGDGSGLTNVGFDTNFIVGTAITMVDGVFSGNLSIGGTLTYQDVEHIDSVGIITAQQGVQILNNGLNIISGIATIVGTSGTTTIGGIGNTALYVDGNARVVGVLTVGRASVTIDGDNNELSVGVVTITNSSVIIGDNVTIDTGASGINSAPNVLYVAKDGDDDNNGTSIDNAFLTIKAAVGAAQSGTTVKVLSGNYVEDNPIELPAFSAVVGDDLRTCKILPNNATSDIFHVNKGCKLQNMTFSGHLSPSAAVAFPDSGATNVGGGKWKGPYVQNCTSDTTTGTGIRIDGSKAVKTKSMNVDAFTQYNQGGVGVAVTNEGYAQLVSVFTICCDKAITCHAGGQADVANSNCSFGTLGLVADGKGDLQYIGTCTAAADAAQDNVTINIGAATTRPYDGQIVFFGELFESVETITVGSGGTGYTSTPTVTVDAPTGSSGETATAFATLEGESVASVTIISSGSQYQTTPSVTISAPDVGVNTATATANMAPIYYTINSSTPIVSGITTLTLEENLINAVGVGTSVHFFQQSKIVASSHTFEYIGAGNTITEATPKRGGVTIQANEVTQTNGGNVVYTSTDQSGNFRIGDDLQINQNTGTISGRAFSRSLFTEMTPFILALS